MEQLEQKIRALVSSLGKEEDYFEHRVGSHSDDYGGESDNPCYCNKPKAIQLHHVLQAINILDHKKTARGALMSERLMFESRIHLSETVSFLLVHWELTNPLSGQSEETIAFLNEILN